MIHIILGTKAQLIKMAPIMARLQERRIAYNFIFTGQHQETIESLRHNFNLKEPDHVLHKGSDITSIPKMFFWMLRILWQTLSKRKQLFQQDKQGIVLVHGDTFSTLLGALMGCLAKQKVAHIESGLRSFKLFHPFPEELTRLIVFKLSDYYFCPGSCALDNLSEYSGNKYNTQYNTLLDALRHVTSNMANNAEVAIPEKPYCVISTHRFENWVTKDIAEKNVQLIETIAKEMQSIFILHSITKKKLLQFKLFDRLQDNPNIELRDRYDYVNFIFLVHKSAFLVSDGGSNQEECFYMGKPCLLLRKASERVDGLGENAVLSHYDLTTCTEFVRHYQNYIRPPVDSQYSPSEYIINNLDHYYTEV